MSPVSEYEYRDYPSPDFDGMETYDVASVILTLAEFQEEGWLL